jgi:hypothetical protein
VPFTIDKSTAFDYSDGDYIYVPGIREAFWKAKRRSRQM